MLERLTFPLFMFLLVITAGGVLPLAIGGLKFYIIILTLQLCLFAACKAVKISLGIKTIILTFASVILFTIFQLVNTRVIFDDEFPKFIFRIIISILTIFLYLNYKRDIKKDVFLVLEIVAFHALFNFIFGFFVEKFLTEFQVEGLINIKTFFQIFFYESRAEFGTISILRNQSFFWEPGVLSVFLNILLYICFFEYKNKALGFLVLFLILTTFSTTGLLLAFIQILFVIKNWLSKKIIYIVPGIVIILLLLPLLFENLSQKFNNDNSSFLLRAYDYQIALSMLSENFSTGIGFGNQLYLDSQYSYNLFQISFLDEPRGNTNSIVTLFVAFGFFFGSFILYKLYHQSIFEFKIVFFIIMALSLSSEPLIFTSFFMVIAFSGFFKNELEIANTT